MHNIKKTILGATGASLAALSLGLATPAHAVPVDRPLMDTASIDLGTNFAAGQPVTGAFLRWQGSVTIRPKLTGNLQLSNGVCGRVRMQYYGSTHNVLATRTSPVRCAPSTSLVTIDSYAHPAAQHVHITLQRRNNNGSFTNVATTSWNR